MRRASLTPTAHRTPRALCMQGKRLSAARLRCSSSSSTAAMFYGSSSSMSLPSKNKLKRQSRTFTQVLYRTLSHRDRRSVADVPERTRDDPAELSTQTSAPGVLKVFGDEISAGANYKSVLATPRSSACELVKEALERYALGEAAAGSYALCDAVGRLEGPERRWRTECLRVLGDYERPLLLQDLWRPKEGFARRFELRKRAEVEEMASREKDTVTAVPRPGDRVPFMVMGAPKRSLAPPAGRDADINAQARKLQRNRAKGALTPNSNASFCRSLSETSINLVAGAEEEEEPKRFYSTLPGPLKGRGGKDGGQTGGKKEERENGGVKHSLYQSPHLLLLQGYNRQDCLVYLLNRDQHTVGQETASARPNICLSSPDILPLHCKIRKVQLTWVSRRFGGCGGSAEERLMVEPMPQAAVLVNFSRTDRPTHLRHGDLLSFGAHYIFLYKDPLGARPLPAQTLVRLRTLGETPGPGAGQGAGPGPEGGACRVCGAHVGPGGAGALPARRSAKLHLPRSRPLQKRKLQLDFEQAHEDELIGRIVSLVEPGGDENKLTPAYLLCLCIKHSANAFQPGSFGKLLLKIVKKIQSIAWDKTKELAQKQAQHQDPASLSLLSISDLVPDLQLIFFWMSNAIEILYFIQQKSPVYMHSIEQLDPKGSKESLLSATISANEEAMSVLEELIMYTFQQCVYYVTKSLYVVLPGLLDCNPFQENGEPCWRTNGPPPEPVRRVLQVFQTTQDLLKQYEVHPEIQSQMFSYLFFFSNVSLLNQLLDKGPARGLFQRSRALQMQTCLKMLMDWAGKMALGPLADKFLAKFRSAVSILATPPQKLMQMSWKSLCLGHPTLRPVQLHRILTQYQLATGTGPVAMWAPSTEEETLIYRTVDLLESFDNHPPIVLPSSGFRVDLEGDTVDENIYRQLLYIRHFLWGLRTKPASTNGSTDWQELQSQSSPRPSAPVPSEEAQSQNQNKNQNQNQNQTQAQTQGEGRLREKLQQVQVQQSLRRNGPLRQSAHLLDSSNTIKEHGHTNGLKKNNGFLSEGTKSCVNFPVSSSHNSSADDFCCVFVVELEKGPYGLGMGLIDGLHTPLNSPGIYIRTLIPDGPAASDGRLHIGDRILAVNGTSLIGADYQSAVDLIRLGGGRLRFLVAKSDMDVSEKISSSSC